MLRIHSTEQTQSHLGHAVAAPVQQLLAEHGKAAGYQVLEPIAIGGQGAVLKAVRLADRMRVAIKVIRPDRVGDSVARARFAQEAAALARLNHPGIVRVVDQGELPNGELWLATEYVSGQHINEYVNELDRERLDSAGPRADHGFPLRPVLDLFVAVCEAVEAAHHEGILHRDLKPANIIVDNDGKPHVLDFGLARMPDPASPTLVSQTGQFMGSPAWSSPEQLRARPGLIDERSDVYSLGVILYQLLTGQLPYDADDVAGLLEALRTAEPPNPGGLRTFIDRDLDTIVLTAIAKDRSRRYGSVAQLREDVQRYLRHESISARRDSAGYVLRKLAQRHPVIATAVAAGFVLSLIYGVAMTVLFRRAVRAENRALVSREAAVRQTRISRRIVYWLISKVNTELSKRAGLTEFSNQILQQAYDQLVEIEHDREMQASANGGPFDANDPLTLDDYAILYKTLGDVAEVLGQPQKALEQNRRALAIREKLAAAEPNSPQRQADLSIALVRVGDELQALGDEKGCQVLYERAMAIDHRLATKYPDNSTFLDNLCWSYDRMAYLAMHQDDSRTARELIDKRLPLAFELVKREPNSPTRLHNLACALYQLDNNRMPDDAFSENPLLATPLDEMAKVVRRQLAIEPDNKEWQGSLTTVLDGLTWRAIVARDASAAEQSNAKNWAVLNQLLAAEPNTLRWRKAAIDLTHCDYQISLLHDDRQAAETAASEALKRADALVHDLPGEPDVWYIRAAEHRDAAERLASAGRPEEARKHLARAIDSLQRRIDSGQARAVDLCMQADLLVMRPELGLGDPPRAISMANRAIEKCIGPSPRALVALAKAQLANRQVEEARRTAEKAQALLPKGQSELRAAIEWIER